MVLRLLRISLRPFGLIGFGLAATFAVTGGWSLPEFCWSTWLAGLIYAWACVLTGAIQIIGTARSRKPEYDARFPPLGEISPTAFLLGMTVLIVPVAWVAFYVYGFAFGFYGLFLSFFAEMQPHSLFGRNGFINSNFFDPVAYLTTFFWPMAAGTLMAYWEDLFRNDPWQRMLLPFRTEILRVHVLIVAMPFLALLAWALVGDSYHSIAIVLLMGLFYLLPRSRSSAVPKDRLEPEPVGSGASATQGSR
jgi:hypothetical protein